MNQYEKDQRTIQRHAQRLLKEVKGLKVPKKHKVLVLFRLSEMLKAHAQDVSWQEGPKADPNGQVW